MERASISELKSRLSAFLKKVRAGGVVVVYDRDQPIARIERIGDGESPEDRLGRLERSGLIRRGRALPPLELLRSRPPRSRQSVLGALIDERREGR
jgi:antitoxin (DNA-binding transcriptional repressor) of toxin-antitoxin stability system